MIEEQNEQPNPDELLKEIQKQEKEKELGRLKIFFGMSAGVGKTYTMLQDAHQKLDEGVGIVIGTVNTHGRVETEALVQGLPIIPEKWVKYKDSMFQEMDLESIIKTKPQIVLVDELAHSNVPGSKHPKRWQDVIEILDAGIDVYTTMNVQHLESRKDLVESLTGIQIRETVPDLILERAAAIELVDIPPQELLQRLKEGRVYIGDQSRQAAEHFFKEENLMALREIALRFTAEKVDHDLHGILHGKGWKTRERLMVAINPSVASEQLIRASRRLAFELDAPWIVVYVDTGITLTDQEQSKLNRHFNLARELGAEVITTHDIDITTGLQRVAKQHDITRIVIGRPPKRNLSLLNWFQGSFIDRLENDNKQIDIVILRQETLLNIYQRVIPTIQMKAAWNEYLIALLSVAAITALGFAVTPFIGYKSSGYIFLLAILVLSFFVRPGPVFLAAALSAFSWDFLFIPPVYTIYINDAEDITLLIIYFFVAAISGTMTSRMHEKDLFLRKREETIQRLYEIELDIANSTNFQYLRLNVISRLENYFPGKFDILIKGSNNQLNMESQLSLLKNEKEQSTAIWVYQNGKIAGWSTDTLPSAAGIYFPIKYAIATVGIIVYFPRLDRLLSMDEMNFIQSVAQQLGIYLERYIFEERVLKQDYSTQIERMHQSIFHSINRSFYTPLEGILKINQQLQKECGDQNICTLANQMEKFISNFKFTIDNVIAISKLESGFVRMEKKKNSLNELIEQSCKELKSFTNGRKILVVAQAQLPLMTFDFNFLKLALNNLLLNALEYSESSKSVIVKAEVTGNEFKLSVLDEGPGISKEILPMIFEKFYHGTPQGLGLGLAIVKDVVDIHEGKIEVKNRDNAGTDFSLILPK